MNRYLIYFKDGYSIDIFANWVESAKFKANLKTGRPSIDIKWIQYLGIRTMKRRNT